MELIDKEKVIAELERLIAYAQTMSDNAINSSMQQFYDGMKEGCTELFSSILPIKTEDAKIWHRQSEKDIYDSFNDWNYHTFLCLMDDGTVQKFSGICDECVDGTVNKHIDAFDDKYDDVDKIVYWVETPITLK